MTQQVWIKHSYKTLIDANLPSEIIRCRFIIEMEANHLEIESFSAYLLNVVSNSSKDVRWLSFFITHNNKNHIGEHIAEWFLNLVLFIDISSFVRAEILLTISLVMKSEKQSIDSIFCRTCIPLDVAYYVFCLFFAIRRLSRTSKQFMTILASQISFRSKNNTRCCNRTLYYLFGIWTNWSYRLFLSESVRKSSTNSTWPSRSLTSRITGIRS